MMRSKVLFRVMFPAFLLWLIGCAAPRAAAVSVNEAPPPVEEPEPLPDYPFFVWTAREDVPLRTESGEARIPHLFTRLNVLAADSLGVQVRCLYCIPTVDGWLAPQDIVFEATEPRVAAERSLAEFALAVREAVGRRDEAALQRVMPHDFTFTFDTGGSAPDAFQRWRFQGYRALDNLPPLLDRGLVTRDSVIWSAPPAFVADPGYHGLRAGFRRNPQGRWEWIYLVGGE
jgi:hypothetical protein